MCFQSEPAKTPIMASGLAYRVEQIQTETDCFHKDEFKGVCLHLEGAPAQMLEGVELCAKRLV